MMNTAFTPSAAFGALPQLIATTTRTARSYCRHNYARASTGFPE